MSAQSGSRRELFGVFGDRDAFACRRGTEEFDAILEGTDVTVGVRDPSLGIPGRTTVHETDDGLCVVWGEAFAPGGEDPARWLLSRFASAGRDAFEGLGTGSGSGSGSGTGSGHGLDGSYVAVLEHDGRAIVATDPVRSWDCFYAEVGDSRTFGTDCAVLGQLLDECPLHRESLLEFLHLSVVTGDRTLFEPIRRVPFDGYLDADGVGTFSRFTYEPDSFDYAGELATRLREALGRRADYPGRRGLLLSAGQDSRSFLAGPTEIDHCYTIGTPESQEGRVARRLADQYGVDHTFVAPDGRYLEPGDRKIRSTGGLRESLHVHHAGFVDEFDVDTVYHGLLFDTLFKGYFLDGARDRVFGTPLRRKRLAAEHHVDPAAVLLDTLAYRPDESRRLSACAGDLFPEVNLDIEDPRAFLRDRIEAAFDGLRDRADSVYDLIDLFVLQTQPAGAFHVHLADTYLESYVAVDADLLEWHRRTPPRYRHPDTVHDALVRVDGDIFTHPPPGRPTGSEVVNQIDRFARRTLPGFDALEPVWPDRERLWTESDLDERVFPDSSAIADLSVRWKLRANDARWWRRAVDRSH